MKLWTSSSQCRIRVTDRDYFKDLFRRIDPCNYTSEEVFRVLLSEPLEWSSSDVCREHSLQYLTESTDFATARKADQELSANGVETDGYPTFLLGA